MIEKEEILGIRDYESSGLPDGNPRMTVRKRTATQG